MFVFIKFLTVVGVITAFISDAHGVSSVRSEYSEKGLVHDAGFYAKVEKIDGPDYFGHEPEFQIAYEKLRSQYGYDYLPKNLPKELWPIRSKIYHYLMKDPHRKIYGKESYSSGERGINNPVGFRFWPSQLPTKIARLSYCFGISPRIITALIQKESNFIANAESSTGAVGFMQITAVGGAEVLEMLGYPNPHIQYNSEAAETFKEYINCYLGEERPWVDPWTVSDTTVIEKDRPVVSPQCQSALTPCRRGSRRMRQLRGASAKNFDLWITGKIPSGSHDYGLVIGAVLLKYHLGHSGIVKGLQNFNGDSVKVAYSRDIRSDAKRVELGTFDFSIFKETFRILYDGTRSQLKALGILKEATQVWETDGEIDENIIQELKSYELPGHEYSTVKEVAL